MKSNVYFLKKWRKKGRKVERKRERKRVRRTDPDKPVGWNLPQWIQEKFNLYTSIFCLLLPHSDLEMMRLWQVATVTVFNLLSVFRLLFHDYFIHLPFTLSSKFQFLSLFSKYVFPEKCWWGILQTLSIWFSNRKLFRCFVRPSPLADLSAAASWGKREQGSSFERKIVQFKIS